MSYKAEIDREKGMLACHPWRNTAFVCFAAVFALAMMPPTAYSQTVTATLGVGTGPRSLAVSPVTNSIYVANYGSNNVTVIGGAANGMTTVAAGTNPYSVAVNPVTNKIYVANYGSANVTVIDGASNSTITVAAGNHPYSVAVNPITNKVYVANYGSANVTVIDGVSNSTTTVAAGANPYSVAVNPVTNKIYVANYGSASVTMINGATNGTTTVAAGTNPYSVAVNPVTNQIYVANYGSASVTVINGVSNSTTTVAAGTNPYSVAVNAVTNQIYVADYGSASVTVINGVSNSTTTVAAGTNPYSVAVNPTTDEIYVANYGSASVTVINGVSNSTTTVAAGTNPSSVTVNPVTDKIYVAEYGSNGVTVIDGATNATVSVPVGPYSTSVAVNPVTNKIYIANYDINSVTIIDGAMNSATTVPTGTGPNSVAVNPVTNKVYVTNNGNNSSNTVTVIDGATNSTTTVLAGTGPCSVAVNPVSNNIYVCNCGSASVTVIDGATNGTSTVALGDYPSFLAVNPVTNKIYVASSSADSAHSVTVINGVDNTTTTIAGGAYPSSIAVNPVTNFIYVADLTAVFYEPGYVTVINGATNSTITVPTGTEPVSVAVNAITNRAYVINARSENVTVLAGDAYETTIPLPTALSPTLLAVNPVTNKIYVVGDLYQAPVLTVIDGASNSTSTLSISVTPAAMAVNSLTNKIYIPGNPATIVIYEEQVQPVPLTTGITPLTNNQTINPNQSFTFSAQSTTVTVPDNVFFQLDTWQNAWTPATGSNSSYTGTLASVPLGFHILYAYAGDGQEATSTQAVSPLSGAIQAYGFLVTTSTPRSQFITFPIVPGQPNGGSLALIATSSSTLPVSFRSTTPNVCTVSGGTASFLNLGTCTIAASQADNAAYAPAIPVSQSFAVELPQTITFAAIPAQTVGQSLTLNATASSGLPVTFSSATPNVCTVAGPVASFGAAGTCTITASQAGNSTYAGTSVSQSFHVNLPVPTTTTVTAKPATSDLGESVVLTAALTSSAGSPSGSVAFFYGHSSLGSGTLNASGVATVSTQWNSLPLGSDQITATYSATGIYGGSSGSVVETVVSGPASVVSVSPASGTGASQLFTAVYSDSNGVGAFYDVAILFNTVVKGSDACAVIYYPSTNNLYLENDTATGGSVLKPGSSASVSNSQCTLSGVGSSVTESGNHLTVTYALTFTSTFSGLKNVYLRSEDIDESNSNWVAAGKWTP